MRLSSRILALASALLCCAALSGTARGFVYDSSSAGAGVLSAGVGIVEAEPELRGQAMAKSALEYLDYPYVWAASDPGRGFDCSGLIYYVMQLCGYKTPWRTAADMRAHYGEQVERGELLPGDLVFFHSSSEWVGHVGIYIGDGQFVHASSGSRKVIVSSLSESYYDRNYVGANRIT